MVKVMEGASNSFIPPRGGGGAGGRGTPLYRPYKYVPPKRVWVLCRFGLKTGVEFGLDMVFEETAGVYVYLSFSFQMNMKEKYSNSK